MQNHGNLELKHRIPRTLAVEAANMNISFSNVEASIGDQSVDESGGSLVSWSLNNWGYCKDAWKGSPYSQYFGEDASIPNMLTGLNIIGLHLPCYLQTPKQDFLLADTSWPWLGPKQLSLVPMVLYSKGFFFLLCHGQKMSEAFLEKLWWNGSEFFQIPPKPSLGARPALLAQSSCFKEHS